MSNNFSCCFFCQKSEQRNSNIEGKSNMFSFILKRLPCRKRCCWIFYIMIILYAFLMGLCFALWKYHNFTPVQHKYVYSPIEKDLNNHLNQDTIKSTRHNLRIKDKKMYPQAPEQRFRVNPIRISEDIICEDKQVNPQSHRNLISDRYLDTKKDPCDNYFNYLCGNYPFRWYVGIKLVKSKMKFFKDKISEEISAKHYHGIIRSENNGMILNKMYDKCKGIQTKTPKVILSIIDKRVKKLISIINSQFEAVKRPLDETLRGNEITRKFSSLSKQGYQSLFFVSHKLDRDYHTYKLKLMLSIDSSFPVGYIKKHSIQSKRKSTKLAENDSIKVIGTVWLDVVKKAIQKFDDTYTNEDHNSAIDLYNSLLIMYYKSMRYTSRMSLDEINDMFFYSHFNIIDYAANNLNDILKEPIERGDIISTNVLPFIINADAKLGGIRKYQLDNFLKLYCSLGIVSRWHGLLPIPLGKDHNGIHPGVPLKKDSNDKDVNQAVSKRCIRFINEIFPLSYCRLIKEFIGDSLKNADSIIEDLVSHVIEQFKTMLMSGKFNAIFNDKYNTYKKKTGSPIDLVGSTKAINSIYTNVAKCHSKQWEDSIEKITKNFISLNDIEKSSGPAVDFNSNEGFYRYIITLISEGDSSSIAERLRMKMFKIHRKNFFRNHYNTMELDLLGAERLYRMISEASPRYNRKSHEIIFPMQMLLSPIVNTEYSFEKQSSFYSFFIAHELTHVIQRVMYRELDKDEGPKPNQKFFEDQADTVAMDVSLSFLKRFGISIKKSTFKNILQFWCMKNSTSASREDTHSVGAFRVNNIISSMSSENKHLFSNVYKC